MNNFHEYSAFFIHWLTVTKKHRAKSARCFAVLFFIKINAFLFDNQGALHRACVNRQDVLARKADKEQLNPPNEQKRQNDRHRSRGKEIRGIDQLENEANDGREEASSAHQHTEEGGKAHTDLRIRGKRQHRRIVQREEIVMRLPRTALGLLVLDLLYLRTKLRNDTSNERCRIAKLTKHLDKALIVKSKAREMLDLLNVGHLLDKLIIARSEESDELVFLARGLDRANYLISLLPVLHERRDHFNGILKIRAKRDRAISARLTNAVIGRVELTEISRVEYRAYLRI